MTMTDSAPHSLPEPQKDVTMGCYNWSSVWGSPWGLPTALLRIQLIFFFIASDGGKGINPVAIVAG